MDRVLNYQFIAQLKALDFVDAIYLYGSRARGDNQPRSDIDLAIVCPHAVDEDWLQIMAIIDAADTLLEIDCVRYDTLTNLALKKNIDKERQILYEK